MPAPPTKARSRAAAMLSSLYDSDDGLGASEVPGSPWRASRAEMSALDQRHAVEVARANREWTRRAREMRLRAQAEAGIAMVHVPIRSMEDGRRALLDAVPVDLAHRMSPFDSRTVDYLVRSLDVIDLGELVDDIVTTVAALRTLDA